MKKKKFLECCFNCGYKHFHLVNHRNYGRHNRGYRYRYRFVNCGITNPHIILINRYYAVEKVKKEGKKFFIEINTLLNNVIQQTGKRIF